MCGHSQRNVWWQERIQETTTIWILWQNTAIEVFGYVTDLDLGTLLFSVELASLWVVRTVVWLGYGPIYVELSGGTFSSLCFVGCHSGFKFCVVAAKGCQLCNG